MTKSLTPCGIGLRLPHIAELLKTLPKLGFLEVHSENYFCGGLNLKRLLQLRETYDVSLHGVGLSLGNVNGLDKSHIAKLKNLIAQTKPFLVSEHLSFSNFNDVHVPDLLPVPLTKEALEIFCKNIDQLQNELGRQILVENPSNYIAFKNNDFSESEFLKEICQQTNCAILLDVNNIAVSAHNIGLDCEKYILEFVGSGLVKEVHLAGFQINELPNGQTIFIDNHGNRVYDEVWDLYAFAIQNLGQIPSLIEWDSDIPQLDILLQEAKKADFIAQNYCAAKTIFEAEYA